MSRRAVTWGAAVGTLLLSAGPALADSNNPLGPYEGEDPGESLGTGGTLLVFVVLPLLIAAIIGAITLLPGSRRSHRYRPNRGWDAAPVWFAGPAEPAAAVQAADRGDVVRGGASGSW